MLNIGVSYTFDFKYLKKVQILETSVSVFCSSGVYGEWYSRCLLSLPTKISHLFSEFVCGFTALIVQKYIYECFNPFFCSKEDTESDHTDYIGALKHQNVIKRN